MAGSPGALFQFDFDAGINLEARRAPAQVTLFAPSPFTIQTIYCSTALIFPAEEAACLFMVQMW